MSVEFERAGGIHDAVAGRQARDHCRTRACSNDDVVERKRLIATVVEPNLQGVRVREGCASANVGNLALLGKLSETAGEFSDDGVLEIAQTVEVNLRLREFNAPRLGVIGFVDDGRHVQQGLRRNTTDV